MTHTTESLMELRKLAEAAIPTPAGNMLSRQEQSAHLIKHMDARLAFARASGPHEVIELLDALEARDRRIAELEDVLGDPWLFYKAACVERDTFRDELNAMSKRYEARELEAHELSEQLIVARRALAELDVLWGQEPVARIEISVRGSTTTIDNHFSDVVRDWPAGEYQLYAAPVAPAQPAQDMNAELVSALERAVSALVTERAIYYSNDATEIAPEYIEDAIKTGEVALANAQPPQEKKEN